MKIGEKMRLENWVLTIKRKPYLAPELCSKYIGGDVYGSDKFEDGTYVTTTSILEAKDGKIYTKSGSIYTLGKVNENYEKQYPNALKRLMS